MKLQSTGLATDLYQLTMAAGYFVNKSDQTATFELFVRKFPANRSFLIAAGLEQALKYITELKFLPEEIDYLSNLAVFSHVPDGFFDYLSTFRFSGDVWAMPEGTPFFPYEPLLRVTAPIIEAQLLETYLLSTINFQTMIASKAARIVEAAVGRGVVEFGTRRAHGMAAGLYAARAAFIGGCVGTSNVEAGFRWGIPVSGTMAHSWVMSYENERDAFRAYADLFPETAVLLLDTYDTITGAKIAGELKKKLMGVRLDSGDFADLSRGVRQILDDAGLKDTKILASGDLDETKIAALVESGSPIDSFGVGTMLSTSWDAPSLGGVYKLVEQSINGKVEAKMKLSDQKSFYPGKKQVWRKTGADGKFSHDVISRADEEISDATSLLECVMHEGRIVKESSSLDKIQAKAKADLERVPVDVKRLNDPVRYRVEYSKELEELRQKVMTEITHLK
ncbi:MAG TPA: nicotinate phosphoribosyltransferase [Blastocatellia bacterium]|nr:nicotinate phosphoribosyltransferase [Blastocatellia bacterium]